MMKRTSTSTSTRIIITLVAAMLGWYLGRSYRAQNAIVQSRTAEIAAVPRPNTPTSKTRLNPLELSALAKEDFPAHMKQAYLAGWSAQLRWLAEQWAERDPAALFEFMTSPQGLDLLGSSKFGAGLKRNAQPDIILTQACFAVWLRRDPAAAQAAMEQFIRYDANECFVVAAHWTGILNAWLTIDPAAAMQRLAEHSELSIGASLTSAQYRSLAAQALTMPPCKSRGILFNAILKAFAQAPEQASAWLSKLTPEARLDAMDAYPYMNVGVEGVLAKAFSEDDLTALDNKLSDRNTREKIARLRGLQDPAAATAWATEKFEGLVRNDVLRKIVECSLPTKPAEVPQFLANIPPGPLHDHAVGCAVKNLGNIGDPRASTEWILQLPERSDRLHAIATWAPDLLRAFPKVYGEWITELPSELQLAATTAAMSEVELTDRTLAIAALVPDGVAVQALQQHMEHYSYPHQATADTAARQPAGRIRETIMAKASEDAASNLGGFNQAWLDWSVKLPTPADRAAALNAAKEKGTLSKEIEAAARQQLGL